jgi:hypothetical protein
VEGSCEHGNQHSGSIKCKEVLEWLAASQKGLSVKTKDEGIAPKFRSTTL